MAVLIHSVVAVSSFTIDDLLLLVNVFLDQVIDDVEKFLLCQIRVHVNLHGFLGLFLLLNLGRASVGFFLLGLLLVQFLLFFFLRGSEVILVALTNFVHIVPIDVLPKH